MIFPLRLAGHSRACGMRDRGLIFGGSLCRSGHDHQARQSRSWVFGTPAADRNSSTALPVPATQILTDGSQRYRKFARAEPARRDSGIAILRRMLVLAPYRIRAPEGDLAGT